MPRSSLIPIALGAALGAALAACSAAPAPSPTPLAPPSVLLVTIDTLRADRVGAYGDALARTPVLDGLARSGVLFESAFAAAPITLPSHATILTGLLPPAHGVRGNGSFALPPGPRTLAEALKARGLATGAFVGAFPLARRFGLARGFDRYDDALERAAGLHFEFAERRADRVVSAAIAWLAERPGPVFAWVHLYDPHAPYDPPPAFRGSDPYRGEVAFADSALGTLLAAWDARPGSSVVVVTADHGEAFGEHDEESHSLFVYDTTLRVPLIVRTPAVPAGRRVAGPVSLVDVAATIADLAGAAGMPGASLRSQWGEAPRASASLYAESLAPQLDFGWSDLRAWRDGRFKLIRAPRVELYDVVADPRETTNLATCEPTRVRALSQALDAALANETQAEARLDPEAAERLRSLGYAQGPGGRGSGADPKDKTEVARRIARAVGPFAGPGDVVRAYRPIAALDPANPLVNFRLADALLRAGLTAEAVPLFRKVVDGAPRTADPFVGLATAYAQQGKLDDAGRVLEQALAVDPANGQVHFNLGELARARRDLVAARREYEAALADDTTRERAEARLRELL
jgi:arylsulfatase A-like enzyme